MTTDEWITLKPQGKESENYHHLFVEEGETKAEAIKRQTIEWGKRPKQLTLGGFGMLKKEGEKNKKASEKKKIREKNFLQKKINSLIETLNLLEKKRNKKDWAAEKVYRDTKKILEEELHMLNEMITTDKKEIDINGYVTYFDVPMTKIGVFQYLGKTISPELEPGRVYNVLRPKEELTKPETLKSLENIPFVDDHTMIGERFMPAEQKGVHGVTGKNVKVNGDLITNDLIAYSDKIKDLIEKNKRDLSMGYRCRYELAKGEYNGQPYDAIQRDIIFNHIALVDEGRMGAECRVTDNAIVYDSLDIKPKEEKEHKMAKIVLDEDIKTEIKEELKEELKQDLMGEKPEVEVKEEEIVDGCESVKDEETPVMDEDKRKLIDEIGGILKDKVDEEIVKTVMGIAEKIAYAPSETGANDEDEPKEEEVKEEVSMDEMIKTLAVRDELVSEVRNIVGDNKDYNKMTVAEVVGYACDKLDIKPSLNGLRGYIKAYKTANKNIQVTVATDSAFKPSAMSAGMKKYLGK